LTGKSKGTHLDSWLGQKEWLIGITLSAKRKGSEPGAGKKKRKEKASSKNGDKKGRGIGRLDRRDRSLATTTKRGGKKEEWSCRSY